METTDECGKHMTVLRMIVVVRAIKVGGHHRNIVCAVLAVKILAILQTAYLGEGVSLVGLLKFRGEET